MRTIFYDQDEAKKVEMGHGHILDSLGLDIVKIQRRIGETDESFRNRIIASIADKEIRKNSYIRIAAYFFLFTAGVLAGMAIAAVMV